MMRRVIGAAIYLACALRLRAAAIYLQRWILERNAVRVPLAKFETPEQLEQYVRQNFVWRNDTAGRRFKFWDWPSDPRVFQARIDNVAEVGDGDCDDVHLWAATILAGMVSVDRVYLLSVGYAEPTGGHTIAVYRTAGGHWYAFDYRIRMLAEPNVAPHSVVTRMRKGQQVPRWYLFETLEFKPVAVGPSGKVPE